MKISIRTTTWVTISMAIIVWGIYSGLYFLLNKHLDAVYDKKDQIQNENAKIARLTEIEEAQSVSGPLVKAIDEHIVGAKEEDLASFLGLIESVARNAGTKIHISALGKENISSNKTIENLKLTVSVEGGWAGVFAFVKMIESLPYDVDVKRVSLSSSVSSKERSNIWTGSIEFSVIAFKK